MLSTAACKNKRRSGEETAVAAVLAQLFNPHFKEQRRETNFFFLASFSLYSLSGNDVNVM